MSQEVRINGFFHLLLHWGILGLQRITHALTIDPNFQRDIQKKGLYLDHFLLVPVWSHRLGAREVQPGETLHLGGSVETDTRLKGPVLTSGIFVFTEKVSKRSLMNWESSNSWVKDSEGAGKNFGDFKHNDSLGF